MHKGLSHKELKESNDAMDCFYTAIKVSCERRDAYMVIGDMYAEEKNYKKAIQTYQQALMIKPEPSRMFSNGPTNTWYPHQQIARAYMGAEDNNKALSHLKIVYNYTKEERIMDEIRRIQGGKTRILIADHIGSFTKDFKKYLEGQGHEVILTREITPDLELWADRIWVEWGDINAVRLTHHNKAVIRIHGYEAYLNKGMNINWNARKVVFVADHIMRNVLAAIPAIQNKVSVIPNG
jgi:tetratricopeptide (TPR) repeat protein